MIGGFQNIFKIPDLKKRILITAGLLIVFRIGCYVSTPGIDGAALSQFFQQIGMHVPCSKEIVMITIG